MLPASIPAPPRAHRRVDRPGCRRARRPARGFTAAGTLLSLLIFAGHARADAPPLNVTWTAAFIAGVEGRQAARTQDLTVGFGAPVELHLVVEGEQSGGLPIYCTTATRLRISGRALPDRMLTTPEDAGLDGSEVRWQELLTTEDGIGWRQRRIDAWDRRWSVPVLDLPGIQGSPSEKRLGTMRFAIAVEVTNPDGARRLLSSDGGDVPATPVHPESAPGFRLTRYSGHSLVGRALGFSRLPVVPGLPASYARAKVALAPIDLVVAAYEDLGKVTLESDRDAPLDATEWSWLFETIARDLGRRSLPSGALVTPGSRGLAYGTDGVLVGDVLVTGEQYAILQTDGGDGWLSEDDMVVHVNGGTVRAGPLAEVPGTVHVLRPRDFQTWRSRLERAGYGELGKVPFYNTNLAQACREFQRDRGMEAHGIPDGDTEEALDDLLDAMDAGGR